MIPYRIYTDPEVAQVGLTPSRAQQKSIPIVEHRLDLRNVDRRSIAGEEDRFAVIYTRQSTGEVVGALLIAADAGGLIGELTLAIANRVPLDAVAKTVHGPGRKVPPVEECRTGQCGRLLRELLEGHATLTGT